MKIANSMNIKNIHFTLSTPEDDTRDVFLVGNFNNWKPSDQKYKMQKTDDGYTYNLQLINTDLQKIEYKYTKGDWSEVELGHESQITPNRTFLISEKEQKVSDHVPRWRHNWLPYKIKKLPIIELLDEAYDMYPLPRKRPVWVLLPWDYHESEKDYSVLYMNDAQNLFGDRSDYGSWNIDHKLATLAEYRRSDVIIVAIDHGGVDRAKEYNLNSTKLEKAEGKKYLRFLVDHLKPKIDEKFRTKPDRENTAIGGSSLGGLISIFAAYSYPEVFGKFLIFSPSIWTIPQFDFPKWNFYEPFKMQWYFYSGKKESKNHLSNVLRFIKRLRKYGKNAAHHEIRISLNDEGKHEEYFWGLEFPKAIETLFYGSFEDPTIKIKELEGIEI